ncbi:biotin-dependent carboxyltransferase family protein [Paenibacillus endoradicis]|uniref:5-oxoprolinase subunit C family protein n=1 Tax=Paenibacillus endoradicis TaxID=2972487 RepID=UPI002158A193|nr:biotin-dependent carboxyltransferase family protein [Paenibacillus endoradicis]MCR8660140.1 biotin-dependent carboxyltransferase family protein [Paenibacillus endoradicis]
MGIEVIRAGMLTTIQDLGRYGYQKFGLNINGAMDEGAARVANILVGNEEHNAVLELTLTGTTLKMTSDHLIAICGGDMSATMNGQSIPMWQPFIVNKDALISFGHYKSGCRVYIAIAGGIKIPAVLGSYSTNMRANIGGYEGRALCNGDIVEVRELLNNSCSFGLWKKLQAIDSIVFSAQQFAIAHEDIVPIRFISGPEYDLLDEGNKRTFTESKWVIDSQSDRMGYRLQGPSLNMIQKQELISEGVVHGTVQLPANGQPIVLLADRQTTGGYPRIAVVAAVDIPMFGQLKPGSAITFVAVTIEEAEQLLFESEQDIKRLKIAIQLKSKH